MDTVVKKINRKQMNTEDFAEASRILHRGGLVAFPTETVYGLGGNALDPEAAARIYAAKGRPSDNPLIVHIADVRALDVLAVNIPQTAWRLAERFWPGPLTMILQKSPAVPLSTTGGLETVAIRMPSDEIAEELIRSSGLYIAAPSANASGRPSTTRAEHVYEDLAGRIEMILDGGPVQIGLESTIIDLTTEHPLILRPGYISLEDIRELIPEADYDPAVLKHKPQENIVAKAPGMKYRHYAPKGCLTIYEGDAMAVVETINRDLEQREGQGHKCAVLATDETKQYYRADIVKSIGSRKDEEGIAARLFDILREFDEERVEYIYSESFEGGQLGQAIMNRLLKAAGYHVVEV